jgi:hypothetical protein
MKKVLIATLVVPLVAGCALVRPGDPQGVTVADVATGQTRPVSRPEALETAAVRRPPAGARTAEALDTTTAEERAAAAAPAAASRDLGVTVASLGDPARPGFWLETPLVRAPATGQVAYQGKTAQVDLIPIDGPATGGSRLSLAAMRLLGAPLTGLPEIRVYRD